MYCAISKRCICGGVLSGLISLTAAAQSINIDFGDAVGTPPSDYSAAGLAGVWNNLTGVYGIPQPLVGLDGSPIAATFAHVDCGSEVYTIDDEGTSGNEELLVDDFIIAGTDVVCMKRLEGLENGEYQVITYAWMPEDPDSTTGVWYPCLDGGPSIGGVWPGHLEEGITHAIHAATVTDGTLEFCTAGGIAWTGVLNGMQLVKWECAGGETGICALPPDPGPCDGICPRYYFNCHTGQCEPFTWGCCDGNENNFLTLYDCQVACGELTIPTLSEWGMVAMALLVLTAGTLVLLRASRFRGQGAVLAHNSTK